VTPCSSAPLLQPTVCRLQRKWVDPDCKPQAVLYPPGVAYYYLIYVAIPYYVAGFPVKKYGMDIL
jgi:hypothetical protein